MGKLPIEEANKLLKLIKKNPKVIVPPTLGYDSGVHLLDGNECLVVSTDPCIGVPENWFGWLLIHYAASDVALFGAKPQYCTIILLGPPTLKSETFMKIMKQACNAAEELNMSVVTGHTGTYDGVSTLVGACTAYGQVRLDKLITPGGAKAGDCIICTKQIGLETILNFTLTHRTLAERLFGVTRSRELQNLMTLQTCVNEANLLAELNGTNAMHDATEGGLVAALNEMAESSQLGFLLDYEKIPVLKEAKILQKYFGFSKSELLSISSTGNLLAAVDPKNKDLALKKLRQHSAKACVIGTFTRGKKRQFIENKRKKAFPKIAEDPYGKIISKLK